MVNQRMKEGEFTDAMAEALEQRPGAEARRILRALCDRFDVKLPGGGGDGEGKGKKRERPSVSWGNSLGGTSSVDLDDFDRKCDVALGRISGDDEDLPVQAGELHHPLTGEVRPRAALRPGRARALVPCVDHHGLVLERGDREDHVRGGGETLPPQARVGERGRIGLHQRRPFGRGLLPAFTVSSMQGPA